ncbi:Cytosine deaminase [Brettanomyces bruxellensis]|uniref:Cytosine deaminase n=2 Tax=Dekkera bruxellensis TaxID=5007 RepID=A0A8H6ESD6_DEKBR|nr:Cytosine deaminase [Brettanomyces bruxellensis]KAF6008515.1 Cytosine deaminase [Brettanomyces bruxellensis]KAF6016023.1 Cytosine deaminase [Brettanomyces bruxellensis]QOU22448.1 Cytosine deaminase [Brettanomyces bruxellensis]
MTFDDKLGMQVAFEEAKKGFEEGGVPIGACLLTEEGKVIGRGHNMRVQKSSATLHGETSCFENAGRLPASVYKKCTLYTTLSPCSMCSGAALLFKIPRIVLGENETFVGAEKWLESNGVEVVNVHNKECKNLMDRFIKEKPEVWNEDIGE